MSAHRKPDREDPTRLTPAELVRGEADAAGAAPGPADDGLTRRERRGGASPSRRASKATTDRRYGFVPTRRQYSARRRG